MNDFSPLCIKKSREQMRVLVSRSIQVSTKIYKEFASISTKKQFFTRLQPIYFDVNRSTERQDVTGRYIRTDERHRIQTWRRRVPVVARQSTLLCL